MSREKITSKPVQLNGPLATGRDYAAEIVEVIGKDNLLDIKFLIEQSSSATRDEILAAALVWVTSAEKKRREGSLSPISN